MNVQKYRIKLVKEKEIEYNAITTSKAAAAEYGCPLQKAHGFCCIRSKSSDYIGTRNDRREFVHIYAEELDRGRKANSNL